MQGGEAALPADAGDCCGSLHARAMPSGIVTFVPLCLGGATLARVPSPPAPLPLGAGSRSGQRGNAPTDAGECGGRWRALAMTGMLTARLAHRNSGGLCAFVSWWWIIPRSASRQARGCPRPRPRIAGEKITLRFGNDRQSRNGLVISGVMSNERQLVAQRGCSDPCILR